MSLSLENLNIAIIGLGYVGLPLALELAKHFPVSGFDIDESRISELKEGFDRNREHRQPELRASTCSFTHNFDDIKSCNVYIVTVPTPINEYKKPDLQILKSATGSVAKLLKKNDIVVFESTVYPGVTEEICAPILEEGSGLKSGQGFFLGYSPERINPGDQVHRLDTITKVVAGQTSEVTDILMGMYGAINDGNVYRAKNIMTAEASKAIENAQRDINIAFVNEMTMLLNKMGLSAYDVLEAAGTKWNFLPFTPGLVGGHCIGVDPFYLAQAAINVGHEPDVILAGRKINDNMGAYIAGRIDRYLNRTRGFDASGADILLMGFTFKENINDIRNTKVVDVIKKLEEYGHKVDIHDPHASPESVKAEYGLDLQPSLSNGKVYDCIALTVAHSAYTKLQPSSLLPLLNCNDNFKPIIYDVKGIWKNNEFPESIQYKHI